MTTISRPSALIHSSIWDAFSLFRLVVRRRQDFHSFTYSRHESLWWWWMHTARNSIVRRQELSEPSECPVLVHCQYQTHKTFTGDDLSGLCEDAISHIPDADLALHRIFRSWVAGAIHPHQNFRSQQAVWMEREELWCVAQVFRSVF